MRREEDAAKSLRRRVHFHACGATGGSDRERQESRGARAVATSTARADASIVRDLTQKRFFKSRVRQVNLHLTYDRKTGVFEHHPSFKMRTFFLDLSVSLVP